MPLVSKSFSDIITFSRGSNATYFDSAGVLKYAPNNAIRNNTGVGAVAGTPGTLPTNWSTFTPLTGLTREIVGTGIENGINYIDIRLSGTPSGAGLYLINFEANNQTSALNGQIWSGSSYFKLQSGTLAGVSSLVLRTSALDAALAEVSTSSQSFTPTSSALNTQRIIATLTNASASVLYEIVYLRLSLSGAAIDITLRIGLPQLEIGNTAGPAIPTSGTAYYGPRLDYNPSTLAAQGLLIEEQRTNLATNSADFSSAFGVIGTSLTVTSDVTTSPDGGTNADSVVESAATEIHYAVKDFSITGNATYSFSVFVKNFSGSRYVGLRVSNTTWTNRIAAVFDPRTGTWAIAPSTAGSATGATGAIQDVGNGWYKVTIIGLPDPAAATVRLTVALSNTPTSSLPSYAGDGTSGVYIWGAQLEAGAFPTSYIPTTTTALTRAADVASVNTLSPWFNASEGTIYSEFSAYNTSASRALAQLDDTGFNNRIFAFIQSNNGMQTNVVVGGSSVAQLFPAGTYTSPAIGKVSQSYAVNNFASCFDGGAVSTDTSGAIPTVTQMRIGFDGGSAYANGHLRRITYYPRRLSDAELVAITS